MKQYAQVFLLILLISSCSSAKKIAEASNYEKDLEPRSVNYNNSFAILPFTLNYTQSKCYPIIKINNSFFLLDTGNAITFINEKGLQDLFYDSYEFVKNNFTSNADNNNFNFFIQSIGSWNIPSYSGEIKSIPFYFSDYQFDQFEGFIGEDAFMQFSNVIIDYKNKLIIFDGEIIKGDSIPMIIDEEGLCFIEFLCDGRKETGLIDTGADNFVLRSTYFEKNCDFHYTTKEQIEMLKNRKIQITDHKDYSFNEIKIGKTKYKKMNGLLASDSCIKMTDEARGRTSEYSLLGFPFFKDKIIQLDYKNKVFRIGK
ncbi:MAG: hypothetical protein J6X84_07085 [Treponema sp.]|nr:hypothetical protein [Treponema sp.]